MAEPRDRRQSAISRREVLRRSVVVGSITWATPLIQSISPRTAFAQVTPGCMAGCFWVKIDENGACEDVSGQPAISCPDCLADEGLTQDPGGCPCVANAVTMEPCTDPPTGTWTLTLPPGCTFHGGGSKCSSDLCQPAVDNGDGTVTFFPCTDPSPPPPAHCISHIEFCYCCA